MMRTERTGNLDELKNQLQEFSIRPVLTAHPTQFYPGRVLAIITDLTEAIKEKIENYSIFKIWNNLLDQKKLFGYESQKHFYHLTDLDIFKKLKDL